MFLKIFIFKFFVFENEKKNNCDDNKVRKQNFPDSNEKTFHLFSIHLREIQ